MVFAQLAKNSGAIILMDTPYRLQKTLTDLKDFFPQRKVLLGLDLTQETEQVVESLGQNLLTKISVKKAEFIVLIYPA